MTARRAITQESASKLNGIAQGISPVLFWTCNYEPTINYAIGQDAAFQLGIQDLYKFAIDTNCVLKTIAFNPRGSVCGDILTQSEMGELRRRLDLVQAMRGIFDHNQSDLNGRLSVERRDSFDNWVRSRIGKDEPTSLDDFEVLCSALADVGNDLVGLSETILLRISERHDGHTIVNKWIDATLRWYCVGSRQEYYRSQLSDYYIARAQANRVDFLSNTDAVRLRMKVNDWIQLQTTYRYEESIRRLCAEERGIQESLDRPTAFAIKIRDAQPEMYEKALQLSRDRLQAISEEVHNKQCVEERIRGEIEGRFHGKGVAYFFDPNRLEAQLRETLDDLESTGEEYTLLPQSFLQLDVERHFSDVPSPSGDFQ